MAATTTLSCEIVFTDKTTAKLSFGPYAETAAAVTNFKTNLINANKGTPTPLPVIFIENVMNANGAVLESTNLFQNAHIITTLRTDYDVSNFVARFKEVA